MKNYIQVQITFPSSETAKMTAARLVEQRLAACAQILGPIRSVYVWNGKLEQEDEILLVAKTKASLFDELAAAVRTEHPYKCPQIVAVPIVHGTPDYFDWIAENTR